MCINIQIKKLNIYKVHSLLRTVIGLIPNFPNVQSPAIIINASTSNDHSFEI